MIITKTNKEFKEYLKKNYDIFIFGAGNIAFKTFEKYNFIPNLVLDNNPDISNTKEYGILIKSPQEMDINLLKNAIIIICSTSIQEINLQLISLGINESQIILSPLLNQVYLINQFENKEIDFILSSGLQNRHPTEIKGGGLYRIKGDLDNYKITKIIEGPTHGICEINKKFFVVTEDLGICVLNEELVVTKKKEIKKGLRPHGISYSRNENVYVLACSYGDCVFILNSDLEEIGKVMLSDLFEKFEESPQHHCNDIFCENGLAYVSAFSVKGHWKQGIFDGGVIIIDIASRKVIDRVHLDCLMPHNICSYEDELLILDSLNGRILGNGFQTIGQFNGFTRGFSTTNSGVFLIGQSKNRNFSRLQGKAGNISLDNSVLVFDPSLKISRTILMPNGLSEIHAIHSLI
tara:strand:+ start:2855 stop:4072 length:1218 start_codon:yes stop_codon:yes gene_type:complete